MGISFSNPRRPRVAKTLRALLATSAIVPLVAACGSSSSSGSPSTSTPAPKTTASATTGSSNATVATAKVPGYGVALSTGSGATVFLFTGKAGCTGACAKEWKPVVVTGKPVAGSGIKASLLSTVKLSDGSEQVTYGGHALYTHPGISATASAGTAADGGIWYLVSPTGAAITKTNGNGY